MCNATILQALKNKFGETVTLIDHDKAKNLVLVLKEASSVEYVIFDVINPHDEDICFFQNGSYLLTFEEAILKYLERKNFKFSVQIPLSEEDLSDLLSGEDFDDWEFESKEGVQVKVELFNESYREEN